MPDLGREAAIVLAMNLGCLLLVLVIFLIWRKREPMTAAKLRRTLARRTPERVTGPPMDGDMSMCIWVLRELREVAGEQDFVRALLTQWTLSGAIGVEKTAKRRLESFGAERQATLRFTGIQQPQEGAEAMLFAMLRDWADEDSTLQESLLYNRAREQHATVHSRLEQFLTEGRHLLRARGSVFPEAKKRRFGFLDENRTIYTARGVREAGQLMDYRAFLRSGGADTVQDAVFTVLFGGSAELPEGQADCIAVLTKTLFDAMYAGSYAEKDK